MCSETIEVPLEQGDETQWPSSSLEAMTNEFLLFFITGGCFLSIGTGLLCF